MKQHPFIFSNEPSYRLRRHFVFWGLWWLFFSVLYSYTPLFTLLPDFKRLPVSLINALLFLIPHMFFSYILMYYVIPRFALRGKYVITAISVILLFFATASLSAFVGIYVLPTVRYWLFLKDTNKFTYITNSSFFLSLLAGLRGAITVGGLAAAIKLMKYWYVKEQRNLQLQKENIEAQMQLLKAQIHPHFMFNTLNNVYSLTQNTSPTAAKMISGMSDLLRYMLYEGSLPLVSLSKELAMIKDYINLEKVRYGNKLELHLDLPSETNNLYISPLLLLPFVENCFKHGTSHMLEQPWINLQMNIHNKQMRIKLVNGKCRNDEMKKDVGIGIKNVRERLLLIYPGKHELTITNEEEMFIVNLKIELVQKVNGTAEIKKRELLNA